jgi:hypothetical protein
MWLSTNQGFLSIVANPAGPEWLLVRARRKGDIESLFPDAEVKRTPGRDYLYRASIERGALAVVVARALLNIDYGNFKNSVHDDRLHEAYADVWRVMSRLQAVSPYGRDSPAARKREGVAVKSRKRGTSTA